MRKMLLLLLIALWMLPVRAQDVFDMFIDRIDAIDSAAPDEAQALADELWDSLVDNGNVPLVTEGGAVLLYKGEAESVVWPGDYNGWNPDTAPEGQRAGTTDLWYAILELPDNARVEYKIVLNGSEWILDPANPQEAWGGFGPNSNLMMPGFTVTDLTEEREGIEAGTLGEWELFESESVGYTLGYRVYTPAGYEELDSLPVIYVTDGQEFSDENLGRMQFALDNLIADGDIAPVMAVFINARDPENQSVNRREREFIGNERYARFIAEELVPAIDAAYKTDATPEGRTIQGTSLGGVAAAFIGVLYPDVFDNVAMFSPALWAGGDLMGRYEDAESLPSRYFFGHGSPEWDTVISEEMLALLDDREIDYTRFETVEGHAWSTWRGLTDEMLVYLFGE